MNDEIKHYLTSSQWPEPRADLGERIMRAVEDDGVDDDTLPTMPGAIIAPSSVWMRAGLALGLVACLGTGYITGIARAGQEPQVQSAQWPTTSARLAYYMAS